MSRAIYVPCDDSLLMLSGDKCPKCGSENATAEGGVTEGGDPWCDLDCLDCGHLWGWRL